MLPARIGAADGIGVLVGELALDGVGVLLAAFIQQRGGGGAEAVGGDFIGSVAMRRRAAFRVFPEIDRTVERT